MDWIKGVFPKFIAIAAVFFVAGYTAIQLESIQDWVLLSVLSSTTVDPSAPAEPDALSASVWLTLATSGPKPRRSVCISRSRRAAIRCRRG
jgi:hypothetical protein